VGLEPTHAGLGTSINRAFADTAFEKVIKEVIKITIDYDGKEKIPHIRCNIVKLLSGVSSKSSFILNEI